MIKKLDISSRVIHGGQAPDPTTGAIMPPIYATSTYIQESPGKHTGFEYSRAQNPTRFAYERCIADLESGTHAYAFSSGLATIASILDTFKPGDHIIACDDLYGGTFRLFDKIRKQSQGLEFSFIDFSNLENLKAAIKPNTKMIWVETPTNPLLKIADLSAIRAAVTRKDIILAADNTFATPILQRPLELGFDIVIHSATKYLGGHSDIIGGVAVTDKKEIAEKLEFMQYAVGSVPSPFDCFLALRGIKTLAIRMKQHCDSAMQLASWLETLPQVEKVYYPGLPSHTGYEIAKKQMSGFGGMMSVVLNLPLEKTKRVLENTNVFALAESLGGVESLIEHPAIMTHASVPKPQREALGISDGLIRLSVGIEHINDLKADLTSALSAAS